MLKRGGTHLATIPKHLIWIECACGHTSSVPIADVLKTTSLLTVADVIDRAKCLRCFTRNVKEFRLVYQPNGVVRAMEGAEQGKPDLPPI
ncbi:hypothetical protein [Shimia sediminis]|uniref:hypothetical protein n=1 Tax=Shimia sediminis TaxID=2497945 RepID=UPI000F8DBA77|nr:hypothetical protein [Shimia sediminis]